MPEMSAGLCVERNEIAVAHGAEHDAAGGGEDAVGERGLKDLEVPHRLAGLGIERLDSGRWGGLARTRTGRTAGCSRAPDVLTARFERGRRADVLLPVFRVLEIQPA